MIEKEKEPGEKTEKEPSPRREEKRLRGMFEMSNVMIP